MLSRRAGLSATAELSCLLLVLLKITPTQRSALFSVTIISFRHSPCSCSC